MKSKNENQKKKMQKHENEKKTFKIKKMYIFHFVASPSCLLKTPSKFQLDISKETARNFFLLSRVTFSEFRRKKNF